MNSQVPVRVEGPVCCGDYIGPKGDGSGVGVVTSLAAGPVIGIALGAKEGPAEGVVKTLCFAGFNALTPLGADFKRLFAQARRLEVAVGELRDGVAGCERGLAEVRAAVAGGDAHVRRLEARIEMVEGLRQAAIALGIMRPVVPQQAQMHVFVGQHGPPRGWTGTVAPAGILADGDGSSDVRVWEGAQRPGLLGKAGRWVAANRCCATAVAAVLLLVLAVLYVVGHMLRGAHHPPDVRPPISLPLPLRPPPWAQEGRLGPQVGPAEGGWLPPFCGDGVCDERESLLTCKTDCGNKEHN